MLRWATIARMAIVQILETAAEYGLAGGEWQMLAVGMAVLTRMPPTGYGTRLCVTLARDLAAVALAIVSTKEPEHFRSTLGGYFHGMVEGESRRLASRPHGLGVAPRRDAGAPAGQGRGPRSPTPSGGACTI